MWPALGSNRYGVCAPLLKLSYQSGMTLNIRQDPKLVVTLRIADWVSQSEALFDVAGKRLITAPYDAANDFSMSFRISLVKRCG
jgi:hypothetical protein